MSFITLFSGNSQCFGWKKNVITIVIGLNRQCTVWAHVTCFPHSIVFDAVISWFCLSLYTLDDVSVYYTLLSMNTNRINRKKWENTFVLKPVLLFISIWLWNISVKNVEFNEICWSEAIKIRQLPQICLRETDGKKSFAKSQIFHWKMY